MAQSWGYLLCAGNPCYLVGAALTELGAWLETGRLCAVRARGWGVYASSAVHGVQLGAFVVTLCLAGGAHQWVRGRHICVSSSWKVMLALGVQMGGCQATAGGLGVKEDCPLE